ncbi:MAG TPA: iron-containing alcohol dehydrogenase, partial [Clostridia bacterium]
SFLDPRYTQSMEYETTVNTAIDAFSHALEGYITKRSTPASDVIAKEAIRIFGECIKPLFKNEIDISVREKLLYMSMLAGMVISQTGTTILHGMGYSLTYFKDIPHGMANGLLMYEYLRFNYDVLKEKIDNVLQLSGFSSLEEFGNTINSLIKYNEKISDEEIMLYTDLSMKQKSLAYNIKGILREDIEGIFKRSLSR